jgi:hypothetical protein
MSVAIFESEFGDTQFVELVEAFCDHAIVIVVLGRAAKR